MGDVKQLRGEIGPDDLDLSPSDHDILNEILDGPTEINLTLDRTGIQGLEERTDQQHVTEWLKIAFSATTANGADVMTHLIMRRLIDKFENIGDRKSIILNGIEVSFCRWAILSSRFPGNSNKMACLLFKMFGLSL